MRSQTNAPIMVTVLMICFGFVAQAADPQDSYQGPVLKLLSLEVFAGDLIAKQQPFLSTFRNSYW